MQLRSLKWGKEVEKLGFVGVFGTKRCIPAETATRLSPHPPVRPRFPTPTTRRREEFG